MSKRVSFNINHTVRIKLTPHGRQLLSHRSDAATAYPVDDKGWSQEQLWQVMQDFGRFMSNGGDIPFETTIELVPE